MLREVRNPDLYHGAKKKRNFFEGWYFKVCDRNNDNVFAFIPGIAKGSSNDEAHSFVQVLEGKSAFYSYIKFNEKDFKFNKNHFHVNVKNNSFSLEGIKVELIHKKKRIKGFLKFKNIKKWPDTLINPGSMGFYNYLWFMECYSQVCVQDGEIVGELQVGDEIIDFNGGKVYVEKNWGKSFPKSWIWVQSNSFEEDDVAFTCSIGRVPFLLGSFSGFLVGLYIKDKFYSFTTINKSTMEIRRGESDVEIVFRRKNLELKVKTQSEKDMFMLCMGPKDGEMIPLVEENLKGEVELELRDIESSQVIYGGKGKSTGIEYGGEMVKI
ncbi:tocopherol cyclase family protein [Oceanirhabdus sp. W0125-5]|uniref:tocopherol cyclase family protein n=1 Tax=Oceanirhabdus sp. W0125-5 TaxID=2999116 RepID=UPI0022F32D81|nr:tocopherol cyclase family protein [Oceanirhabdus sp. W0125-5]WBW96738.1 tocopherol cyclase family protein [Oceanirhabdus sp. W0125-5]